jgi:YD repeat-containing protein
MRARASQESNRTLGFNFNPRALVLGLVLTLCGIGAAQAANGSVSYTYDALGRVITASYDTGVIVIYTYDANGNRTQQVIKVNTATLTWTAASNPCTSNCWGAGLW